MLEKDQSEFARYAATHYNYAYMKIMLDCLSQLKLSTVILGSSYGLHGMDLKQMEGGVNLSMTSQDLIRHEKLLHKVLEENTPGQIRTVMFILGYYALYDDLECSRMGQSMEQQLYEPLLQTAPETNKQEQLLEQLIMKEGSFFNQYYRREDNCEACYSQLNWQKITGEEREKWAKHRAERHNRLLAHSDTYQKNVSCLSRITGLLQEQQIRTIVVIPPFSVEYQKHLDNRLKNSLLKELEILPWEIEYYDFNQADGTEIFATEDFFDMDHLNDFGAAKFTKLLKNDLLC